MRGLARAAAIVAGAVAGAMAVVAAAPPARAVERNFAGSAQLDYHFVPGETSGPNGRDTIDGFTVEAALKMAVDVSDRLSASVKVCYGCHGFELPMAYFDFRVADELTVRVGRFSPEFGSFNIRHDPANHASSDKPLPYDMGRMLRWADWNLGVIPSPFPDNGVEIGGTHWLGERVQLDYAAYAVSGFKANTGSRDLDFSQSETRVAYTIDNNGRPAVGGRVSSTFRLGEANDLTAGASFMTGTYDPENRFGYDIVGADVAARIGRTQLRAEYLLRRQSFPDDPMATFKLPVPASGREVFDKHGAYVEVERTMSERLTLFARGDGLYRVGNVTTDDPLGPRAAVVRGTLGGTVAIVPGWRLKASGELWSFTNDPPRLSEHDFAFHLGVVGTF
jgi:hypothetical protein